MKYLKLVLLIFFVFVGSISYGTVVHVFPLTAALSSDVENQLDKAKTVEFSASWLVPKIKVMPMGIPGDSLMWFIGISEAGIIENPGVLASNVLLQPVMSFNYWNETSGWALQNVAITSSFIKNDPIYNSFAGETVATKPGDQIDAKIIGKTQVDSDGNNYKLWTVSFTINSKDKLGNPISTPDSIVLSNVVGPGQKGFSFQHEIYLSDDPANPDKQAQCEELVVGPVTFYNIKLVVDGTQLTDFEWQLTTNTDGIPERITKYCDFTVQSSSADKITMEVKYKNQITSE